MGERDIDLNKWSNNDFKRYITKLEEVLIGSGLISSELFYSLKYNIINELYNSNCFFGSDI